MVTQNAFLEFVDEGIVTAVEFTPRVTLEFNVPTQGGGGTVSGDYVTTDDFNAFAQSVSNSLTALSGSINSKLAIDQNLKDVPNPSEALGNLGGIGATGVQDLVRQMIVGGSQSGLTITYDAVAKTFSWTASGGGGGGDGVIYDDQLLDGGSADRTGDTVIDGGTAEISSDPNADKSLRSLGVS